MDSELSSTYLLKITVRNQPGVLVRCAQVLSRRGHNIEKLIVEKLRESPDFSLMEITAVGKLNTVAQVMSQLRKLIDVIDVE